LGGPWATLGPPKGHPNPIPNPTGPIRAPLLRVNGRNPIRQRVASHPLPLPPMSTQFDPMSPKATQGFGVCFCQIPRANYQEPLFLASFFCQTLMTCGHLQAMKMFVCSRRCEYSVFKEPARNFRGLLGGIFEAKNSPLPAKDTRSFISYFIRLCQVLLRVDSVSV